MPWNFDAEPSNSSNYGDGTPLAYGVKITKTFLDDSGVEVVKVDTNYKDAIENAPSNFAEEYLAKCYEVFSAQMVLPFTESEGSRVYFNPQFATALGDYLREAIVTLNELNGYNQTI